MLLNQERAIAVMRETGADVLLATTPENVIYLSDFDPLNHRLYRGNTSQKGTQTYALLTKEGEGALVTREVYHLATQPSWMQDVYAVGRLPQLDLPEGEEFTDDVYRFQRLSDVYRPKASRSFAEALAKCLKEKGAERATIALDTEGINPGVLESVRNELPNALIKDGCELFRYIRAVKSPEEIERLRMAANINELAMQSVIRRVAVGVSERELAWEHRSAVVRHGALPDFINVIGGKRAGALSLWSPSDYRLRVGDLVWMDGGCIYEHYHSDTGTCVILGEPSRKIVDTYAAARAGVAAALGTVKAGVRCSTVHTAMTDAMRAGGVANPWAFGHAIGIEPRDFPIVQGPFANFDDDFLQGSTDVPLEAGMVINFEAPTLRYGMGGLQVEHSIVVTQTGCELLVPQTRQLSVVSTD